jgi:hypothetical protein
LRLLALQVQLDQVDEHLLQVLGQAVRCMEQLHSIGGATVDLESGHGGPLLDVRAI